MICYLKYVLHGSNQRVFYSFRNLYNYILSFVSKLALVLLLNTYEWFQAVIEVYYTAFGTYASYS